MGLRMMQGWVLSAGLVLGTLAWADDSRGCIDVQVGQTRALAYDCLTRQLACSAYLQPPHLHAAGAIQRPRL